MSLFITLEGPEGGGKTTHATFLAQMLEGRGLDVLLTREPGGSPIGDQIRDVLMSLDNTSMHPSTEFLLFSASRAQLVREIIQPHLERGGVVVCDRFYHSSLAYQGYGHGLGLKALQQITDFATDSLKPDLILLLDLPVKDGLVRRRDHGDWNRLDAYDLDFHRRVRKGYLSMAEEDPSRWLHIDATLSVEAIQDEIRALVGKYLSQMDMSRA